MITLILLNGQCCGLPCGEFRAASILAPWGAGSRVGLHSSAALGQKSIQEHLKSLDWDRQEKFPYVVIDPADANDVLYLSSAGYQRLLGQCISNAVELVKIAGPGTARPDSSAKTGTDQSASHSPFRNSKGKVKGNHFSALSRLVLSHSFFSGNRDLIRGGLVSPDKGNFYRILPKWAKILHFWQKRPIHGRHYSSYAKVARDLESLLHRNGVAFTIKRMKIMGLVIYKYVAGNPLKSTDGLGQRIALTNGLPKSLPRPVRAALRANSTDSIRIWGTLMAAHKAFKLHGETSLSSIVAEPGSSHQGFKDFCKNHFWKLLPAKARAIALRGPDLKADPVLSIANGPNAAPACHGVIYDLAAWYQSGNPDLILNFMDKYIPELKSYWEREKEVIGGFLPWPENKRPLVTGKLSRLYESAGKVRIIAIGDFWSQTCLKPFHKWLFALLKEIFQDGTFDQEGAVNSLAAERHREHYCFDLKSATDNIPRQLYVDLFEPILGKELAEDWFALMTERDFHVPWRDPRVNKSTDCSDGSDLWIRYTRGQPMGFYSSWAALAVLHHAIVQFSAYRTGWQTWFPSYRVLGDDIDLCQTLVAHAYKDTCTELGIPLSLLKGLESVREVLNFAARFVREMVDISPISLEEELGIRTKDMRANLMARLIRRGWASQSLVSALRLMTSPNRWWHVARELERGFVSPSVITTLQFLLAPGAPYGTLVANGSPLHSWLSLRRGAKYGDIINFKELDDKDRTSFNTVVGMLIPPICDKLFKATVSIMEEFHKWFYRFGLNVIDTEPTCLPLGLPNAIERSVATHGAESTKNFSELFTYVVDGHFTTGTLGTAICRTLIKFSERDRVQIVRLLSVARQYGYWKGHPNFDDKAFRGMQATFDPYVLLLRLMELESSIPTIPDLGMEDNTLATLRADYKKSVKDPRTGWTYRPLRIRSPKSG